MHRVKMNSDGSLDIPAEAYNAVVELTSTPLDHEILDRYEEAIVNRTLMRVEDSRARKKSEKLENELSRAQTTVAEQDHEITVLRRKVKALQTEVTKLTASREYYKKKAGA